MGTFWIAKDAKFLHVDNEHCSDCMDVQADFSLHPAHMSEGIFFVSFQAKSKQWQPRADYTVAV